VSFVYNIKSDFWSMIPFTCRALYASNHPSWVLVFVQVPWSELKKCIMHSSSMTFYIVLSNSRFCSSYCLANSKYLPLILINSSCVPFSTIRPRSLKYIISAFWIVLNRCAIASVVLPSTDVALSIASCTRYSDSESNADVASSRRRILGFRMRARAIAIRCL
jgi:hypothetical protein